MRGRRWVCAAALRCAGWLRQRETSGGGSAARAKPTNESQPMPTKDPSPSRTTHTHMHRSKHTHMQANVTRLYDPTWHWLRRFRFFCLCWCAVRRHRCTRLSPAIGIAAPCRFTCTSVAVLCCPSASVLRPPDHWGRFRFRFRRCCWSVVGTASSVHAQCSGLQQRSIFTTYRCASMLGSCG